jgi:hypothetical protein
MKENQLKSHLNKQGNWVGGFLPIVFSQSASSLKFGRVVPPHYLHHICYIKKQVQSKEVPVYEVSMHSLQSDGIWVTFMNINQRFVLCFKFPNARVFYTFFFFSV